MTPEDRKHVIDDLFYEMCGSAFAEGCEDKIFAGLEQATDEQLLAKADKRLTWKPDAKEVA